MKLKFNAAKALPVVAVVLTLASTLVDNKRQSADRKALKSELKDEIIKEMLTNES